MKSILPMIFLFSLLLPSLTLAQDATNTPELLVKLSEEELGEVSKKLKKSIEYQTYDALEYEIVFVDIPLLSNTVDFFNISAFGNTISVKGETFTPTDIGGINRWSGKVFRSDLLGENVSQLADLLSLDFLIFTNTHKSKKVKIKSNKHKQNSSLLDSKEYTTLVSPYDTHEVIQTTWSGYLFGHEVAIEPLLQNLNYHVVKKIDNSKKILEGRQNLAEMAEKRDKYLQKLDKKYNK